MKVVEWRKGNYSSRPISIERFHEVHIYISIVTYAIEKTMMKLVTGIGRQAIGAVRTSKHCNTICPRRIQSQQHTGIAGWCMNRNSNIFLRHFSNDGGGNDRLHSTE